MSIFLTDTPAPASPTRIPPGGLPARVFAASGARAVTVFPAETTPEDLAGFPEAVRDSAVQLVVRTVGGDRIVHARPVMPCPPDRVGYMFGGSYVGASDSRFAHEASRLLGFRWYGAVSMHDHTERRSG